MSNVRKQLPTFSEDISFITKRKKHCQQSDVVRTAEFVQHVQELIIDDTGMPMVFTVKHLQGARSRIKCGGWKTMHKF